MTETRLAVLGSPIAHSLSPTLHAAAYGVLGLDWKYEAVEVSGEQLAEFVATRDETWRGLSLTMPLKKSVLPLLGSSSDLVLQSGSANTLLFDGGISRGYNTDVYGITEAFERHSRTTLGTVVILGAGATAASALVAARLLGATKIFCAVRSPERSVKLAEIARGQGIEFILHRIENTIEIDEPIDAVFSTLPNGVEVTVEFDPDAVASATLLDVAYADWPTPLARGWTGAQVIGGLEMLVLQALGQVRIFVGRDPHESVVREPEVLAAMLASVGL